MANKKQESIRYCLVIFLISIFMQVTSAADLDPPLEIAWKYRLGSADWSGHNPMRSIELITNDIVYVKYGNELAVFNSSNGDHLWSKNWNGGLAYKSGILYLARESSASLYALDAASGNEIWIKEYPELDERNSYDLVIFNDMLCIITKDYQLQVMAVDTDSGNSRWHKIFPGSPDFRGKPVVSSGVMVLSYDTPDSQQNFDAINITTGETLWEIRNIDYQANIQESGELFFLSNLEDDNDIFTMAVSKITGETVWKRRIGENRYKEENILAIKPTFRTSLNINTFFYNLLLEVQVSSFEFL